MNRVLAWTTLFLGIAGAANATVTEPDGKVVPIDSTKPPYNNTEVQIYNVLQMRDAALDWQTDSDTRPETFSPLCSFTAELILKQTASNLGIGWYNVNMSSQSPPAYTDIYQIIPPSSPVGTKVTGQSIKDDPRYLGGLIGFALMKGTNTTSHYSEKRLNIQCSGCTTPGPWITSITYISKTLPNTFFLGFEDGTLTSTNWSNDGDFNDYVFQFTGLTCSGGGLIDQRADIFRQRLCLDPAAAFLIGDNVLAREQIAVLGVRSHGIRATGYLRNSYPGGLRRQEVVSSIANTGSAWLPPSPSLRRDPKSQAEGPNIIYEVASCASTAL